MVDLLGNHPLRCPCCDVVYSKLAMADIRNPFKCPACDILYSLSIDSDNAPVHLNGCAHTVCVRCGKKQKREKEETTNKTPVITNCTLCPSISFIQLEPVRALTVIEVLVELEALTKHSFFETSPIVKPGDLISLKCPGCKKTYCSNADTVPMVLYCGHSLCLRCVDEKKEERSEEERKLHNSLLPFKVGCVKCTSSTLCTAKNLHGTSIEEIVKWLEVKNEETAQSTPMNQFKCSDCRRKTPFDRGILCIDCTSEQGGTHEVVCAYCIYESHKDHASEKLLPHKLSALKNRAKSKVQPRIVKCNMDANVVVDAYKTVMGTVEKCFSSVIDTIPLVTSYSDGITIERKLEEKVGEYEKLVGEIVPSARRHNTMLEDMLNGLKESFPELVEEGGDNGEKTKGNEETQGGERKKRRRVESTEEKESDDEKGEDSDD